ncbi:MAG TPA: dTDP-4-dehydrorhamnose 3,5-epimerase [Flavobacteriales bacterium]|nr:dTDP-4-dehydrorhamnose 3,5-epimerase [Flavobacteriales bacterium]
MKIKRTKIEGLILFEPTVFSDERGYFFENFRQEFLEESGVDLNFVQENESMSNAGSLRGLHLQAPPFAQDKLIRVVRGAILDVAVDVRKQSPTYGAHVAIELNEKNKHSFLVPKGFAHGFYCLEDNTIVQYKCSAYYNKDSEIGIIWNDPDIGIEWPQGPRILSKKDTVLPMFSDFKSPF